MWRIKDKEKVKVISNLSPEDAAAASSWFRDNMPEAEVAADVHYMHGDHRGPVKVRA